jgi:hypothetical protein
VAILLTLAGTGARGALRRQEAPRGARRLVSEVRLRRSQAIGTARTLGLVFQRKAGAWRVSLCADGNGDGIGADDVRKGRDPLLDGPQPFSERYGGAAPGFHPSLESLTSPPPASEPLRSLDDPVRFGSADVITFNPRGQVSSGTLYLTDGRERQLAVVVYGATARVRVWEYDLRSRRWRPS